VDTYAGEDDRLGSPEGRISLVRNAQSCIAGEGENAVRHPLSSDGGGADSRPGMAEGRVLTVRWDGIRRWDNIANDT
jgi:hypothetical protein